MILKDSWHRWAFIVFLSIVAFGLPLSRFAMSIGGIGLAINWLIEGRIKSKINALFSQPAALAATCIFFLYALGLLWTTGPNFSEGLKSVRIMLPLLLFPVVFSTTKKLSIREWTIVCAAFIAGVLVGAIAATAKFFFITGTVSYDFREVSLFISHIRFSLMVCMSVALCTISAFGIGRRHVFLLLFIALLLVIFQVLVLQAFTGTVILFFLLLGLFIWVSFRLKNKALKFTILAVVILAPSVGLLWLYEKVDAFFPEGEINHASLETHTARGGVYDHHVARKGFENGHPIWTYVCYEELEEAWSQRSDIPFWGGKDAKGQFVYTTLIRFLAGKGLRKDYEGLMKLTAREIKLIESGIPNESLYRGKPVERRIYQILWELTAYQNEQRIDGNSVVQRLEYWKNGWKIWMENFMIGTGTGDVKQAFAEQYDKGNSSLSNEWRLLAHNQFLTMALTFGLVGLLVFLFSIVYPMYALPQARSALYLSFLLIALLSMISEDTLNSQVGVTFYAFFNGLLLFGVGDQLAGEDKTSR